MSPSVLSRSRERSFRLHGRVVNLQEGKTSLCCCPELDTMLQACCFYQAFIKRDIEAHVTRKCPCIKQKKKKRKDLSEHQWEVSKPAPLEIMSLNYMHLETSKVVYEHMLVVVDHLTRKGQVYPTKKKCRQNIQWLNSTVQVPGQVTLWPRQRIWK